MVEGGGKSRGGISRRTPGAAGGRSGVHGGQRSANRIAIKGNAGGLPISTAEPDPRPRAIEKNSLSGSVFICGDQWPILRVSVRLRRSALRSPCSTLPAGLDEAGYNGPPPPESPDTPFPPS